MTEIRFYGILEAAINASNLDAAGEYNGGLLGLPKILRAGHRHVFYRVGTTILLVFNPEETERPKNNPMPPMPSHGARGAGHVCPAAEGSDFEGWRELPERAGVAIEADFCWPNGARSLYFRDPAGNSVEMAEPKLWSQVFSTRSG